jgi:hypothetical protein
MSLAVCGALTLGLVLSHLATQAFSPAGERAEHFLWQV